MRFSIRDFGLLFVLGGFASFAADPAPPSTPKEPVPVHYAPAPKAGELLRAEDFPIGITVLGVAPSALPQQRVRLSVERVPPTPPTPVPELPLISLVGVVVRPLEANPHVAPTEAFTRALDKARREEFVARTNIPQDKGTWSPTSSYAEGDPAKPYPWNPAKFSTPIWSQTWATASPWPPGQDLRNWSPVRWTAPILDPVWVPTDTWDRSFELQPEPPQ